MKQRKKYPKTAKAVAGVALLLVVISFKAPAMLLLAAWFGLIALILALGPDDKYAFKTAMDDNESKVHVGCGLVNQNGIWLTESEAGLSPR